jgi:actin-related protein
MESKSMFVGAEAITHRAVCYPSSPIQHCIVTNMNDLQIILQHCYSLLGATLEDHNVIVTESMSARHQDRIELGKMLFDLRVPGVWVVPQGVCGLFATGRTSGVVLDCGEGKSHVASVVDGVALPASKVVSSVSGGLITENLGRLLSKRKAAAYPKELLQEVKESLCFCSIHPEADARAAVSNSAALTKEFQLPDGHFLSVGKERFEATELLFTVPRQTEFQGRQMVDLPTSLVLSALSPSEESLREQMLRNIVTIGGTTSFEGFHDRLQIELNRRAALRDYWLRFPIKVGSLSSAGNNAASDANWIGAAMLGQLNSTKKMFITDNDIKESGMNAITSHRLAEFAK